MGTRTRIVGVNIKIKEKLNIHHKKGLLIQYETRIIILKMLIKTKWVWINMGRIIDSLCSL